jgi:hypothetical protein
MECADAESVLPLVFDGDLDSAMTLALHVHLCTCTACCEFFAEMLLWRAVARVALSQWGKPWTKVDLSVNWGDFSIPRPSTGVKS